MQIREDIDARIAALAAIQHGVIARGQVLSCGGSRSLIDRRVRAHRWEPVHPGVYAVVGSPASFERDVWAAHLAVGAHSVVTHELALSLAGVQRVPRRPLTFTVPHGGHARTHGAFVHQIDDLRPHHVRLSAGLPVSTPARAVVEVASTFGSKHLGTVLDEVVIERRLTSYPQISAVLSEVARPGKRGVTTLGRALDDRSDGEPVPDSVLEAEFFAVLRSGRLPIPKRHVELPSRELTRGVVDGLYDDVLLILEVDGRRWHDRLSSRRRDYDRDMAAACCGFQTLRFVHEHVRSDPEGVCLRIADVRAVRLAQLAGNSLVRPQLSRL